MADLRGWAVVGALSAFAAGCGDDSRTSTFEGDLTPDPVGICRVHGFEAERDAALTLSLVEATCPPNAFPELSLTARMDGVNYLSGYVYPGQSISQANGSRGPYAIEVCMGRFRYLQGCRYKVTASQ